MLRRLLRPPVLTSVSTSSTPARLVTPSRVVPSRTPRPTLRTSLTSRMPSHSPSIPVVLVVTLLPRSTRLLVTRSPGQLRPPRSSLTFSATLSPMLRSRVLMLRSSLLPTLTATRLQR